MSQKVEILDENGCKEGSAGCAVCMQFGSLYRNTEVVLAVCLPDFLLNAAHSGNTAVRSIWSDYIFSSRGHYVEHQNPSTLISQDNCLCFVA